MNWRTNKTKVGLTIITKQKTITTTITTSTNIANNGNMRYEAVKIEKLVI
jgi:hypothetical protein